VGTAVRIVFQPFDLGGNVILVALEVDQPIMLFVAAPLMPGSNTAHVVATTLAGLLFEQGSVRPALVQIGIDDLYHETPAGRSRFGLDDWHGILPFSCVPGG